MKIEKTTVRYHGKDYPTCSITLTEEEAEKHYESQSKEFCDYELWIAMTKGTGEEENLDREGQMIDPYMDYYMNSGTVAGWHQGLISDNLMKYKVAKAIMSW